MREKLAGCLLGVMVLLAQAASADARPEQRTGTSYEAGKRFGVGVSLGAPFAVRAHLYLGRDTALDVAAGVYYRLHMHPLGQGGFHAHANLLTYPGVLMKHHDFWLPLYVGAGVRYMDHGAYEHGHIGLRFPAGLLLDFECAPFDLFAEAALTLDFSTLDDRRYHGMADWSGSVGGRFYF